MPLGSISVTGEMPPPCYAIAPAIQMEEIKQTINDVPVFFSPYWKSGMTIKKIYETGTRI